MAQSNVKTATSKTRVGLETAFGSTPGTMYDAIPVQGTVEIDLQQTEIENLDESVYLYDNKNTVRGYEGGSVKFDMYLKPFGTPLSSSNAPTSNYEQQILEAFFGGKRVHSGSLVQGSATSTSVPVDNGATVLTKGQWALFTTTNGLEPAYVTNMATNTATVTPALSSTPASASVMVNGETFYPTDSNTNSLTIQHRKIDGSDYQWQANGCLPKTIDIKVEREGLATMSCEFEVGLHTTGSVVGVTSTVVTETQTTPFAVKDATFIFQPVSTTTRTHYNFESLALKLDTGLVYVPDVGGSTEGKAGVMRTGTRIFAEATIKFRCDTVLDTRWEQQTDMQMHLMVPKLDRNNVKRWIVVSIPTCTIVGKPKYTNTDGRLTCELTVKSKLNALTTAGSNDISLAPFNIFLG